MDFFYIIATLCNVTHRELSIDPPTQLVHVVIEWPLTQIFPSCCINLSVCYTSQIIWITMLLGSLLKMKISKISPKGGLIFTHVSTTVSFSSCQWNLIKKISDWRHDYTDYKNDLDFFFRLVKWPKIAVKKSQNFQKF